MESGFLFAVKGMDPRETAKKKESYPIQGKE